MKYLLVILLLLCAAPAHAQSPQDALLKQCASQYVYCHTDGSGDVYGRNKLDEQWRVLGARVPFEFVEVENDGFRSILNTCENIMEAAMREIDLFGPSFLMKVFMSGTAYGKGMLKDKDVGEWLRAAVKAQQQWDAAKACWKEKP